MVLAALILAVFLTSIVSTAVLVTVLGDLVAHVRGARGLPTCRRAGSSLLAVTRHVRRRVRT